MKTLMLSIVMLCLTLLNSTTLFASAHAPKTWRISIKPKNGGTVPYTMSSPSESGTLIVSKALKVDFWSDLDLTFTPANGYKLKAVLKNGEDITSTLDSNNHYKFGPITSSHTIKVIFEDITPEGSNNIAFPDTPPEELAPVADVSGAYTGTSNLRGLEFASEALRTYAFDLAVDEAGKIAVVGTLTGIYSTKDESSTLNLSTKMKTVKSVPQMKVRKRFKGTVDGVEVKSTATATIPIKLSANTDKSTAKDSIWLKKAPEDYMATASLKYVAVKEKVRFKDKALPIQKEATSSIEDNFTDGKKWSIKVTISEEIVTIGKRTKKVVYAAGILTLPNNVVTFEKKKIRYKVPKGVTVSFKRGIDKDGEIDKKSKIIIKKMTYHQEVDDSWTISGGKIIYKIMNQKGKGLLSDFTTD